MRLHQRFDSNLNSVLFSCNSIAGSHTATKFCTCHDSTAVVTCVKLYSDRYIIIWVRANLNFHNTWIKMENLLGNGPQVRSNNKIRSILDLCMTWGTPLEMFSKHHNKQTQLKHGFVFCDKKWTESIYTVTNIIHKKNPDQVVSVKLYHKLNTVSYLLQDDYVPFSVTCRAIPEINHSDMDQISPHGSALPEFWQNGSSVWYQTMTNDS